MGAHERPPRLTEDDIKAICPRLEHDRAFRIASPPDSGQNCFGWAAGERKRWDPVPTMAPTRAGVFWPAGVPLLKTVNAFVAAYATIGYEPCPGPEREAGFEKIALYVDESGEPLHASHQSESGTWTSKLGGANDIEHGSPEAVETPFFGRPLYYLRRPVRDSGRSPDGSR